MPYVTSFERLAREEGRAEGRREGVLAVREAIGFVLKTKFEQLGTESIPAIDKISDLDSLRDLMKAIVNTTSIDEIHNLIS